MSVPDEIKALVPEELRDIAKSYYNKKQDTYYFYRLDAVRYDKTKKRGIDVRTPLGKVKNGLWSYSPSYLKQVEIEKLTNKVKQGDRTAAFLSRPEVKGVVSTVSEKAVEVVEEPRARTCIYPLHIVLTVMFLAALGGYTSASSIAYYWRRFRFEFEIIFGDLFPADDISHDTINRLMRLISPGQYAAFLKTYTEPALEFLRRRFIHLDGQCVKGSKSAEATAGRNIFNVYESETGLLLTQKVIDTKENEIPTGTELLKLLDLRPGDVVTADAMNTQRATVEYLASKEIDWCLALKSNHPTLHSEVMSLFNTTHESRMRINQDIDDSNGRITTRTAKVLPGRLLSKVFKENWPGLDEGCIILTENETIVKGGVNSGKHTVEQRYFITSLKFKDCSDASQMAKIIRKHWSIEAFHWLCDVVFNQDRIQSTDTNYLMTRTASTKLAISMLKALQRRIKADTDESISINLLKEMCSTPYGALELISKHLIEKSEEKSS